MTRDWNAEWAQEQANVDDITAMFDKFNSCDHVWIEDKGEQVALSWIDHICVKCGAAMVLVGQENWRMISGEEPEPLIPEQYGVGRHCLKKGFSHDSVQEPTG